MTALLTLDQARLNQTFHVASVTAPEWAPEWAQWLADIGFLPGERVTVLMRAQPGNDPLAVRVGHSTFALRQAEAACIVVTPA